MKGIKKIVVIGLVLLAIFACKKEKEETYKPLLRNGLYFFETYETPSVRNGYFYYLYKDDFFPISITSDSICYDRKAGYVSNNSSIISIPYLYRFYSNNICSFINDIDKGKTYIMYMDNLDFNNDLNSPKFSGYYRMYDMFDSIHPKVKYCSFEWVKD
jgi:hypothetical protein